MKALHFDNLLALLIAIEYKKTPETAFQMLDFLYKNGKIPKRVNGFKLSLEDLEDIHLLREKNLSWSQIADIFGQKSSSIIFRQYKHYNEGRCTK